MICPKYIVLLFATTYSEISVAQKWDGNHSNLRHLSKDKAESNFNHKESKPKRKAWEFDQDDVFVSFATAAPTVTSPPSLSQAPSDHPTTSVKPTYHPSIHPSSIPTKSPSANPSYQPTSLPSSTPTSLPTQNPTSAPSLHPTQYPSSVPTDIPTTAPSSPPTQQPSSHPTFVPTVPPTNSPSSSPSTAPSSEPTSTPTIYPTQSPTARPSLVPSSKPSNVPSASPSGQPSREPSLIPSAKPSTQPTSYPTISKAPSSSPTISLAPSLVISTARITKFTIVLTSPPNTPAIDSNDVINVAESFLDKYFKKNLPHYLKYRGVELSLDKSKGRRLQTVTAIALNGEARFNLFSSPDLKMINKHVMDAFSGSRETFFDELKKSESAGLQSLLNVKTNGNSKAHNAFNTMHLTIIMGCVATVIIGVAASYVWKRNQENNVRKRLLRAAEYTREYKGQPQLDDDCFRDITPEPIQISDDNQALERMVMRARHDRGVMNRANELLLQQSDMYQTYHPSNREVSFAPQIQKIHSEQTQPQRHLTADDNNDNNSEVDIFDEVCSRCSNGSSISPLSRGGSVATDASGSLINLGYNDIESLRDDRAQKGLVGNGGDNKEDVSNTPVASDTRTDDTSFTYSTNTRGTEEGTNTTSGTNNHSDGNAYFTSQNNRQY